MTKTRQVVYFVMASIAATMIYAILSLKEIDMGIWPYVVLGGVFVWSMWSAWRHRKEINWRDSLLILLGLYAFSALAGLI